MKHKKKQIEWGKITKTLYFGTRILAVVILGLVIYQLFNENSPIEKGLIFSVILQCVLLIVYSFLPVVFERVNEVKIAESMKILILLFGVSTILLGEVFEFYRLNSWWDGLMHFMSGALVAAFAFSLINLINKDALLHLELNPFFVALFAFCFSMAIAVIWELFEFSVDLVSLSNMQRYRDSTTGVPFIGQAALMDTMNDFIACITGTLLICIPGYYQLKYNRNIILLVLPVETK